MDFNVRATDTKFSMNPEKKYLTIDEVAALLKVNYQLIYRLVRTGEIPSSRIGRVYRIADPDLDAYLEKTRTVPAEANICSSCGKEYSSKLSLNHECEECGKAICFDCGERQGLRYCKEHNH